MSYFPKLKRRGFVNGQSQPLRTVRCPFCYKLYKAKPNTNPARDPNIRVCDERACLIKMNQLNAQQERP